MAAVLASGAARLSHRSAAHLHGLRATSRARIDVIVPGARRAGTPGIDVHRSVTLTDRRRDRWSTAIPVTTLARMMLDLAAVVDQRAVERVIEEADRRGVFDLWAVNDQLERNPKHPGAPRLRAALGPDRAGLTDSDLEELFVSIWWPTGLPRPQTRFHIDPGDGGLLIRADFAWPEAKFDLETRRRPVPRRATVGASATTGAINGSSAPLGTCCASVTISSNDEPDTVVPTVVGAPGAAVATGHAAHVAVTVGCLNRVTRCAVSARSRAGRARSGGRADRLARPRT